MKKGEKKLDEKIKCQECGKIPSVNPVKSGIYVCGDCLLKKSQILDDIQKLQRLVRKMDNRLSRLQIKYATLKLMMERME